MLIKIPQNSDKYFWTKHAIMKMKEYSLSAQRIKRVIRSPWRKETGIAKNTIAVMQPVSSKRDKKGNKIWKSEIWVMYQLVYSNKLEEKGLKNKIFQEKKGKMKNILNYNQQLKIISAWRFPGVSPAKNPIPESILNELDNIN